MALANVDVIEQAYAAFTAGDLETILSLWTDDGVWHHGGHSALAGDHEGKEGVAGYLGAVAQSSGGTFKAELQNALADDTNGYSLHKATATVDGEAVDVWSVLGYRFIDGKISEIWTFDFDQDTTDRILGG